MKGLSKGRYDETFAGEDENSPIRAKTPRAISVTFMFGWQSLTMVESVIERSLYIYDLLLQISGTINGHLWCYLMSRYHEKAVCFSGMRTTKAQIRLRIRAV